MEEITSILLLVVIALIIHRICTGYTEPETTPLIPQPIKALVSSRSNTSSQHIARQIEDYRSGYPQLSALVAADSCFHICRRFSNMRARLLLLKQDKISFLEQQLENTDHAEQAPLFLSCSRLDQNSKRLALLHEIDTRLADYDAFVKRGKDILAFNKAPTRSVHSLRNFLKNTTCLGRNEREYLSRERDLMTLGPEKESGVEALEYWIEDRIISTIECFKKGPERSISRDSNVFIFNISHSSFITRILVACTVVAVLLAPVLLCNLLQGEKGRMLVIVFATVFVIAMLSMSGKTNTVQLFIAGTAYATVLVVFVSGQ